MPPFRTLLVAVLALSLAIGAAATDCASGSDNTGKTCPPNDNNGPCPTGCEGSSSGTDEAAVACTQDPHDTGFGVSQPAGTATIYAESAPLAQPTTLTSTGGTLALTLTVETMTLDATMFSVTTRGYCLDGVCTAVGPTLRINPGDTLEITLVNTLGDEVELGTLNALRTPNHTNVHTHGLHIDPAVDNVMIAAAPGETLVYTYEIPSDHMAGTHWYHSHRHGASALQVMGGLVGAIIVEPADASALPASYTAMDEHLVELTHFSLCSNNPTSDPFRIVDYQELRGTINDQMSLDAVVGADAITDVYLTNGQFQPTLTVAPGAWTRLEVLNAVGDTYVELELRSEVVLGGTGLATGCEMMLQALDGVFLNSGARSVDVVLLAPASRASVAVKCTGATTVYLQSSPNNRAADYEAGYLQNLLTIEVAGDSVTMNAPAWGAADVPRPLYLQDLQGLTPTNTWEIGVEQTAIVGGGAWVGVGTDCALESGGRDDEAAGGSSDPNTYGSCPYIAFGYPESETEGRAMERYPFRHIGRACDVEDLVIQGRGATPHPMHIHVNHFQIVEVDRIGGWGEIGDWRDTMPALTGAAKVRYVLDGYGGNIMVHCHFLYHEDLGMMDRIWVEPKDSACPRCTAACTACDTDPFVCHITGSYAFAAYDDAYPSIPQTCTSLTTGAQTVDSGVSYTSGDLVGGTAAPVAAPVATPVAAPVPAATDAPAVSNEESSGAVSTAGRVGRAVFAVVTSAALAAVLFAA